MSADQITPAEREDARRNAVIARWEAIAPTREDMAALFKVYDRNGCEEAVCSFPESEACICRKQFLAAKVHVP